MDSKNSRTFATLSETNGCLAQLVQSICLTSRGSAVRIRQRPLGCFPGRVLLGDFAGIFLFPQRAHRPPTDSRCAGEDAIRHQRSGVAGSGGHAAGTCGRVAAIHDFEDFFKKYGKTFGGVRNSCYLCNRLRKVRAFSSAGLEHLPYNCLLYTSPSPRDIRGSRMPSSA